MIVVDASVALAWCLSDEEDELAERVLVQVAADGAIAAMITYRARVPIGQRCAC